jgi:L-lactate dehydrogenase complex protein LldF
MPLMAALAGNKGRFRWMPLAAAWTRYRDLPAPGGATFMQQWRQGRKR